MRFGKWICTYVRRYVRTYLCACVHMYKWMSLCYLPGLPRVCLRTYVRMRGWACATRQTSHARADFCKFGHVICTYVCACTKFALVFLILLLLSLVLALLFLWCKIGGMPPPPTHTHTPRTCKVERSRRHACADTACARTFNLTRSRRLRVHSNTTQTVSYTHLTLPTKRIV